MSESILTLAETLVELKKRGYRVKSLRHDPSDFVREKYASVLIEDTRIDICGKTWEKVLEQLPEVKKDD